MLIYDLTLSCKQYSVSLIRFMGKQREVVENSSPILERLFKPGGGKRSSIFPSLSGYSEGSLPWIAYIISLRSLQTYIIFLVSSIYWKLSANSCSFSSSYQLIIVSFCLPYSLSWVILEFINSVLSTSETT